MSEGALIDGKAHAQNLRARLKDKVRELNDKHGLVPKLSVVLVGEDGASAVYVRNKQKACAAVGIESELIELPSATTEEELLARVARLNDDKAVHGILVQFPLPEGLSERRVMAQIAPAKDVDGLHPLNQGRLLAGERVLAPCTPQACVLLAQAACGSLAGLHAVVIGRSALVGKPLAHLLLQENCTVTLAHSKTRDLPKVALLADLLIAAVGRAQLVQGDWVKPGAVVLDVGINRVDGALTGDVDFAAARKRAAAITPVPGGVGPMTVACLLKNTLQAARAQAGLV